MFNQKDIIAQNIKITGTKDVSVINNNDEDYLFSALTVEGGGVFKKGIAIGIQEKMVPGLVIYDNENFYGFSEKYGLSLLSPHPEYIELDLPKSIFENKEDRLQPTLKNKTEDFKDMKETTRDEKKNLNIDIEIKDINNFYIIIPPLYNSSKFALTFDVKFLYDLDSIISNVSLVFINEADKNVVINVVSNNNINNRNNKYYFSQNFNNIVAGNSISKINLDIVSENHFLISSTSFLKSS